MTNLDVIIWGNFFPRIVSSKIFSELITYRVIFLVCFHELKFV